MVKVAQHRYFLMRRPLTRLLIGSLLLFSGGLASPGGAGSEPLPSSLESLEDSRSAGSGTEELPEAVPEWLPVELSSPGSGVKLEELENSSLTEAINDTWAEGFMPPVKVVTREPPTKPSILHYRVQDNEQVRRFLDQFQVGYRRAAVERWLGRGGRYLRMIRETFREKGLPEELVFTAMIESGFNPVAVSRAGAKGLWQFMAPTARRYGLRVDHWVDERLDPEKSTLAAASYLKDLFGIFGSWNLAKAAYNAGEMRVARAIQAMGTTDFWALTRSSLLADETKDFVAAIQAASLIGQEPHRYGLVVTLDDPIRYEVVRVPHSSSLKRIATVSRVPVQELEELNSELRLGRTPPGGGYPLKVPAGRARLVQRAVRDPAASARLTAAPRDSSGKVVAEQHARSVHVVKPRETLGGIAKRYGISVSEILRWNRLSGAARIFPGDRLRVAWASRSNREEGQGGFR